jgi:hypothetical protein
MGTFLKRQNSAARITMAESVRSQNHCQAAGPQETRRVLPNSAVQNGSTAETNCSSHQVQGSKNHVSSKHRSTLDVMGRNDTNQMELDRVQDELQPLEAEDEQVPHVTAILARI